MKTIGIIIREWVASPEYDNAELYGFNRILLESFRKYDDVIVMTIPAIFKREGEFEKVKPLIDMCDGIVFSGGTRFSTLDRNIAAYLNEIDKPTLGICCGMQILSCTYNGLIKKIPADNHCEVNSKYVHYVNIDKDSLLYKILGKERILVNSRHHSSIVETTFDKVAFSDDDILEAIEDKTKKFFIGVQWHPESVLDDENSIKLFDYFVSKL